MDNYEAWTGGTSLFVQFLAHTPHRIKSRPTFGSRSAAASMARSQAVLITTTAIAVICLRPTQAVEYSSFSADKNIEIATVANDSVQVAPQPTGASPIIVVTTRKELILANVQPAGTVHSQRRRCPLLHNGRPRHAKCLILNSIDSEIINIHGGVAGIFRFLYMTHYSGCDT